MDELDAAECFVQQESFDCLFQGARDKDECSTAISVADLEIDDSTFVFECVEACEF